VRGLTRDPQKPAAQALADTGAEVVWADNDDPESLRLAFTGAYGVFSAISFWEGGPQSEISQGKNIADAVKAAGVQHFIYSSVEGAERDSGIPHFESKWQVEQYIQQLGLPATILRPVEFMENFNWSRAAITNGTLPSQGLRPSRKKMYIAVDDIGAFTAIAFEHPEQYLGKAIALAGDAQTEQEIAETLGRVIGRPVQLVPPQPLDRPGMDEEARNDLMKMITWFDEEGYQADIPHLRSIYPPLQNLETWLRRNDWENAEPMPLDAQGSWS
jgi:uncharacterized protein YbjT (DUF2867 family)